MRMSVHERSLSDLFSILKSIHQSESRSGSHDDTGIGAMLIGDGARFHIAPSSHCYSWTSIQNSTLEQSEREDDWEALLAYWREWAKSPPLHRGYNLGARRQNHPSEEIPPKMRYAIVVEGSYHFGSSVRARCTVEMWAPLKNHYEYFRERAVDAEDDRYIVFHLEDVGHAFSDVSHFLEASPGVIISLAEMDAFKEYKR